MVASEGFVARDHRPDNAIFTICNYCGVAEWFYSDKDVIDLKCGMSGGKGNHTIYHGTKVVPEVVEDTGPKYEITTDDRTVWINGPNCLARFCPVSGEIFPSEGGSRPLIMTGPYWRVWVAAVKEHLDIEVPDTYKPNWHFVL